MRRPGATAPAAQVREAGGRRHKLDRIAKRWQVLPPAADGASLARDVGVSTLTAQLLMNRGIATPEAAGRFLVPEMSHLCDPNELDGVEKAVHRLRAAIDSHEPICVYGDFDVDGITSTALLTLALRELGGQVEAYVPNRMREGYGLNKAAVGKIASRCRLMVTVDCGISAVEEIDLALAKGLDVVVTDHHEPAAQLPKAAAIVDPKLAASGYPFRDLAGVGVTYKLVEALFGAMGRDATGYLDLVTLGTVADVVPLLEENRVLVKHGLPALASSERAGIRALLEVTGLAEKSELGSGQVAFTLAPRINAAGRLASADEAIELMLTDDRARAIAIARAIDQRNRERQQVEEKMLAEALEMVESEVDLASEKSIVLAREGWHEGVKGIVASRLADRFCRPTFLFSIRGGVARGSARSIRGLNLYEVLCKCAGLLTKFGGHAAAAGLTLGTERLGEFKELLEGLLDEVLTDDDLIPKLRIDAEVPLGEIDHGLADELGRLAPFGMGNPSPVLSISDAYLDGQQRVGAKGDHLKFIVHGRDRALEAIAFRLPGIAEAECHFGRADVAFHLEQDEWQGASRLQLRVVDLKLQEPCAATGEAGETAGADPLIERLFEQADEIISDEDYKNIGDADWFYTKVAGVTFEGRQDVLAELAAEEPAALVREPDNAHDPNAIRVVDRVGRQIGFLAAPLAKHLAPVMDGGVEYEASVTEVTGGDEKHLGVNILVSKVMGRDSRVDKDRRDAREEWRALPDGEMVERLAQEMLGGGRLAEKQQEALEALDRGERTLVVMGTGRGKSLIFHVHAARLALAHEKTSVFVYPLRALIADQQQHLDEVLGPMGLTAVTLNGDVTVSRREQVFERIASAQVDVVLTTPEFLYHHIERFARMTSRIGFLVVDESHHIRTSSSGHRPLYRKLDSVAARLGDPLVLATTATAGDEVAAEICRVLRIDTRIVDPSVRDNLRVVDCRGEKQKAEYAGRIAARGEKTIIYVNSREQSVRLAEQLRRRTNDTDGAVVYYNAGLNKEMRRAVEQRFREGDSRVVVATSAFGEGINIPDVRNVILYHMPLSSIEYNQQSGRVGRDGETALIHTLFGPEDLKLNNRLLESYSPSRKALVELYRLIRNLADAAEDDPACVMATNEELLSALAERGAKTGMSVRGVSSGLRIFEELGLVRIEGSRSYRRIVLEPSPAEKLDLSASVRYREGMDEKEAFAEFGAWALGAKSEALLRAVNRPICPTDVAAQVEALFGAVPAGSDAAVGESE